MTDLETVQRAKTRRVALIRDVKRISGSVTTMNGTVSRVLLSINGVITSPTVLMDQTRRTAQRILWTATIMTAACSCVLTADSVSMFQRSATENMTVEI